MKAMLLAAGRGKRMGSLTLSTPKPLTLVNGTPIIEHNLIRIRKSGITEVVVNVSWLGDQIIEFLGTGEKWGLRIVISNEKMKMLGTGGGVLKALSHFNDEPFWLINSDIYTNYKINIKKKLKQNILGHLILVTNPPHNPKGDFNLSNDIVSVDSDSNPYTFSGMSILTKKIFTDCKEEVFPLEPIIKKHARNKKITGEYFKELFIDVGSRERLMNAENIK